MNKSNSRGRTIDVRDLFGRIALRYDLMNRLMTFGQDIRLRREAARQLHPQNNAQILDLGAGTGELTLQVLRHSSNVHIVALDLTESMIRIGQNRTDGKRVSWVIADALDLPFAPCSFDGVISGFLLRNMSNILQTLGEQFRVLKTKGHMICLETSPPPRGLFRPLTHFHLHYVIPCLGRIIANNSDAYRYLSATMEDFLNANALCMKIQGAGFQHTKFSHYMLGTIAIHKGVKCP